MLIVQFFSHSEGWSKSFDWLLGIYLIVIGIARLFPQKKKLYVNISNDQINWLVQEKLDRMVILPWREIQWIKQEPTGSITCYQQSSFSENLSLFAFSEEQRLTIKQEIQNMAAHHGIRLVNF
jgi:hypothetical protein